MAERTIFDRIMSRRPYQVVITYFICVVEQSIRSFLHEMRQKAKWKGFDFTSLCVCTLVPT